MLLYTITQDIHFGGIALHWIVMRKTIWLSIVTLLAAGLMSPAKASVVQPTVILPTPAGAYTFGSFCLGALGRCTENATVSNFSAMTHTEQNGNEVVTLNATYSADIFSDNGGMPATLLGHLLIPGTVRIVYLGRDPSVNPLGTFTTQITDFDFKGMLNANTFEVRQDPAHVSTGSTTILESTFTPPIMYEVTGSIDVLAQYSFNGSPFVSAPERSGNISAIPEPGSLMLAASLLAGFAASALRRTKTAGN